MYYDVMSFCNLNFCDLLPGFSLWRYLITAKLNIDSSLRDKVIDSGTVARDDCVELLY